MWESTEQAIEKVQYYVERNQPPEYRLVVNTDPALIRNEEGWWYIIVRPNREGVRAHEYSERLSDIEDEILEKERVHVLLIPTLVS